MTKEELLRPRYKVIADYPNGAYEIGAVIETYESAMARALNLENEDCKICLLDYPALFKKLEWWEERKPEDLPEYLKCVRTPDQIHFPGEVYKMKWTGYMWGRTEKGVAVIETNCYTPATLEEYNTYTNQATPTTPGEG
jgi:hypothetical protein